MTLKPLLFLLLLIIGSQAYAQLSQDFDNGDLSLWSGDISEFTINVELQLELAASQAGNTFIYTPVTYPDSLIWNLDFGLGFSPSNQNKLDIWLIMDQPDPDSATGFLLSIGETGATDALKLQRVDAGSRSVLAEGVMGLVATQFDLSIQMRKSADDIWTLTATGEGEQFTVSIPDDSIPGDGFFGLDCTYTSSNVENFYFDNIIIAELLPDTEPPSITSARFIDSDKIQLDFNEEVNAQSVADLSNYSGINLSSASIDPILQNRVCLNLSTPFTSGEVNLVVSNIQDLIGNALGSETITIFKTEPPAPGDLLINEILYEPLTGMDADFVELINVSDKFISLDSVFLARANSSNTDRQIPEGFTLGPDDIIAFSNDPAELIELYQPIPEAQLHEMNLINYVNSAGNVWVRAISDGALITIDSFDYSNDFHSGLLTSDQVKGVSLERVSLIGDTNDGSNWFSAASNVNFATPGYINSQRSTGITGDENIELESKVFSPNGDGDNDILRLNYQLDRTGFIANVSIYDDNGRLQTKIADNKLLGTEGFVLWDGLLDDGTIAPIGMYIVYFDIFHTDGEVISGKKVCVLAQQLN